MRIVLTGATGMIGSATLIECLEHPDVTEVLVVGRRSCGVTHDRVREILHDDFTEYAALSAEWQGFDAFVWCLGVSAAGMSEEAQKEALRELSRMEKMPPQADPLTCM